MRFEEAQACSVGDHFVLAHHWSVVQGAANPKRHTLQILTTTSIARMDPSNLCDALECIQ